MNLSTTAAAQARWSQSLSTKKTCPLELAYKWILGVILRWVIYPSCSTTPDLRVLPPVKSHFNKDATHPKTTLQIHWSLGYQQLQKQLLYSFFDHAQKEMKNGDGKQSNPPNTQKNGMNSLVNTFFYASFRILWSQPCFFRSRSFLLCRLLVSFVFNFSFSCSSLHICVNC